MQITPFAFPVAPAAAPDGAAMPAGVGFAGLVDAAAQIGTLVPDLVEAGDGPRLDGPHSGQGADRLGYWLAMPDAHVAGQAVDEAMAGAVAAEGALPPEASQPVLAQDDGADRLPAGNVEPQLAAAPGMGGTQPVAAEEDASDPAELMAAMAVPATPPAPPVPVSVAPPPPVAPGVIARGGPGAIKAVGTMSNGEQPAFADSGAMIIAGRTLAQDKAQGPAQHPFASTMAAGDGGDGNAGTGEPALPAPGRQEAAPSAFHSAMAPSGAAMPANALPLRPASTPVSPHDPMISVRPGHFGQSLGIEIARRVDLGGESFRVRLNPAELGHVEVTLAFDDGGALRATVRAHSAYALELLRQEAPDLARTLEQAGVQADAQSLRFESRGGGSSPDHQAPPRYANQHGPAADDEAANAAPVWRAVRGDGQVDLIA